MADYRVSNGDWIEHNGVSQNGSHVKSNPRISPTFVQAVEDTFDELAQLLLSKHADYGPKNISDSPGGAINGLRVRMHDKLARINNLVDSGADPEHESLEDSFKDMANYAIIGLLVLRNKWSK